MQLLVVRHAPAEDLVTSDFDRALTSKGRKLFREFAQRMAKAIQVPDLILYSPLVRAVQTAKILQEVTGIPDDQMRMETILSPGMSATQLANLMQDFRDQRVAIVGHNPDVSYCTSQLIAGGNIEFKKGSIACIDFGGPVRTGMGMLSWFLSPKTVVED